MKRAKWIIASMALLVVPAYAGLRGSAGVNVDAPNRTAWGDAFSARSAANTSSYITCDVQGYATGNGQAFCQAQTANGTFGYCFSTAPSIVQAAAASGPNSYYYFRWDATGTCNYVFVSNSSSWGLIQP